MGSGLFRLLLRAGFTAALCFQLAACGALPGQSTVQQPPAVRSETRPDLGLRALGVARQMLGIPYQDGGADPDGFDCSGLVHYSYAQAGISLPRTARAQYAYTRPVALDELEPGDLVFFRLKSSLVSHVGMYQGSGKFIHAPSTGRAVMWSSLDNRYWRERWVRGGRIPAPSS